MPPEKKIRTFIALKTPPGWDAKLAALQPDLREKLASTGKFRWTRTDQLHLTLRFLGYVKREEIEPITIALERAGSQVLSFQLSYTRLGCFPRVSSPRVLWAGLADDSGALRLLHQSVIEQTRHIGQPPETRDFHPHLTLARIESFDRRKASLLERLIEQSSGLITSKWRVREVLLMQSHLSPQGSTYEVLFRCPLS